MTEKRKVTDTDTTNGNPPQNLLINRLIPEIIPFVIPPAPRIADGVAASTGTLHAFRTILLKEIVTDTARSAARVFKYPKVVNWIDTDGTSPQDGNTVGMTPRLTTPVWIGAVPLVSPTRMRSQDIGIPRESIGPREFRDAQPLDTSINGIYAKHRDPAPTWSNLISGKFSDESRADVYSRCQMNLTHDAVLIKSPNFMNLGILPVHTSDELGYVFVPTTRIRRLTDGSNCLPNGNRIDEVTADRVIRTRSEQNYNSTTDFETRRENIYFGRQNNSMS